MDRLKVLLILFVALALAMSTAVAQPGRGGGPPGQEPKEPDDPEDPAPSPGEMAWFVEEDFSTKTDFSLISFDNVFVSRDTKDNGPANQTLWEVCHSGDSDPATCIALSEVGSGEGPYFGLIRVLDQRGRNPGRVDYYFDVHENGCVYELDGNNPCPYRLIVYDGASYKRPDRVVFDDARVLLLRRPIGNVDPGRIFGCIDGDDCTEEDEVYASFVVHFVEPK